MPAASDGANGAPSDIAPLAARERVYVYEQARRRHPERWSGETRNRTPEDAVRLKPRKPDELRDFRQGGAHGASGGHATTTLAVTA